MAREKWSAQDPVTLRADSSSTVTRRYPTAPGDSGTFPAPSKDVSDAIVRDLLERSAYYDFYYVVGMMERLNPSAVRVGGNGPYRDEAIRFRHDPSLTFHAGDILRVTHGEKPRAPEEHLEDLGSRFEVTTTFLGLTGAVSPLPLYLAEEMLQAEDGQAVEREFLDIFHHRIISFVYRIGVKYQLSREYTTDAIDPWSRRVLALAGIDAWSGRKLRHIPFWRLLRLAPLLSARPRSGRMLELVVHDLCGDALQGASVDVEQFVGGWTKLDRDQQMALGRRNHALGMSSVIGTQCFDAASKSRIVIGPLGDNYRRFLTDGDMYPVIVEILGVLAQEPLQVELELVLSREARPPFRLGVSSGGRIGVDTWLSHRAGAQADTRLRIQLPPRLPETTSAFDYGWRSKPQRSS